MHAKDFDGWNKLKQQINARANDSTLSISEREIWWVSIGVNVDDEEDGHNELYILICIIAFLLSSSMQRLDLASIVINSCIFERMSWKRMNRESQPTVHKKVLR